VFDIDPGILYNINVVMSGVAMKWSKHELHVLKTQETRFSDDIAFEVIPEAMGIRRLDGVHVEGLVFYERSSDRFIIEASITGTMILPCSITLEDVAVPFTAELDVTYVYDPDDDPDVMLIGKDGLDLRESILNAIWLEKPLAVTKPGLSKYPQGDGWEILSEEDYARSKASKPDPRLVKLKEFKINEEEV
jgi:uncharacterized protein